MAAGDDKTALRTQIAGLERGLAERDAALAQLTGRSTGGVVAKLLNDHEVETSLPRVPPARMKELLLRAVFDECDVVGTLHEEPGRVRWRATEPIPELGVYLEVELQAGERATRLRVRNHGVSEGSGMSWPRQLGFMLVLCAAVESGATLSGFGRREWFLGFLVAVIMTITFRLMNGRASRERYRPTLDRIAKRLRSEVGRLDDALP